MTNYAFKNGQRIGSHQNSRQLIRHEFYTALALIMTSSELLQTYYPFLADARKQELFFLIQNQTIFLSQLIDNVLTFTSPIDVDLDPPALDLVRLCQQVTANFDTSPQPIASAYTGSRSQKLDEELVFIILSRLLSNAVKFSRHQPDTPIEIKLECGSDQVSISVQDRGLGIPAEDQPHVFEPFYRGRNAGSFPGAGLGLAVVARCVEALNGVLEIKSAENAGTLIIVRLPVPASV